MNTTNLLDELYTSVLKDILLLVQLNDYRYDGVVYIPKDENDRDLLFRLNSTDHVLTIWNVDDYPSKFAKILARIRPGSYILDIVPDKFTELCKKYGVFGKSTVLLQSAKRSGKELDKEVTRVLEIKHFGQLERKLLRYLSSNFRFKTKEDIVKEIGDCDFFHLVGRVKTKLTGTRLRININKAKHLGEDPSYQLDFIDVESDNHKIAS